MTDEDAKLITELDEFAHSLGSPAVAGMREALEPFAKFASLYEEALEKIANTERRNGMLLSSYEAAAVAREALRTHPLPNSKKQTVSERMRSKKYSEG